MPITIDKDLCIGCGACPAVCSKNFKMNEENKAEVISQEDSDCAKNAAESCPAQAIKVE
ncbi:ferredoxin [Patescibacteria group bacterium]|nr:ferredoxin [Candidatus Falkowbacteria bacterium]MBU3905934.1 ferredoxin [Patescibacteria group bacterium]MBU4015751.1 ferredoxin [Patescibacteria group bacterium]MBU4026225.1 ferredoxin [Patescibacteria group bacterium]MBU4072675.1 ferredoxin [Patescibacteria group bacterium]